MTATILTERRPRRRHVHKLVVSDEVVASSRSKAEIVRCAGLLSRLGVVGRVQTVTL